MAIKDWHPSDRPREKLLKNGSGCLSPAELLTLFIRTGTRNKNALEISRELLDKFGGIRGVMLADPRELVKVDGVGPGKATLIVAIKELAGHFIAERARIKPILTSPESAYNVLRTHIKDFTREECWLVLLNKENCLIDIICQASGTIDRTTIFIREILKDILNRGAKNIILSHVHPAGVMKPSQNDIEITKKIQAAFAPIGVGLLDHLIIGKEDFYSFKNEGKL